MKRYKYLVLCLLAISLIAFISPHASNSTELEELELQPDAFRLNDSICNHLSDSKETKQMERFIRRWMNRNNIRGASLAIMKNEKLIYCKGFGWADKEEERPAEASDIYRIASASKLITAVGIMKLCDEGKLTLQSKVFGEEGILNQFTDIRDKRAKQITVRHLLNHTAGFSRRMGDPMFKVAQIIKWKEMDHSPSADELISYQLSMKLRDKPGGMAQYSNIGYLILSRVIEQVSGMSYEHYIQKKILWPAGCYDMHIAHNLYEERYPKEVRYYGNSADDTIESYDGSGDMKLRQYGGNDIRGLQGAGGWVASAPELMRLVASIDGKPGVPDIISQKSVREMRDIQREGDYALGWARYHKKEGSLVRTGTMAGTCAYIDHRSNGFSYVFITNTSHYTGPRFTNSIGGMVRSAMRNVKSWNTENDLFVEVPVQKESNEAKS